MRRKILVCSIISFLFFSAVLFAGSEKSRKTLDVFGLSIRTDSSKVSARNPLIVVTINFENKTDKFLNDVLFKVRFPNSVDQYCTYDTTLHEPANAEFNTDALNRKWASWALTELAEGQKDSIQYRLRVDRFPADTLFFHHMVAVLSRGHSVSELGTEQTWIPSQGGWGNGPNLWIDYKIIDSTGAILDSITTKSGDIFTLRMTFGNSREYEATNIRVRDWIPAGLEPDFANGTVLPTDSTGYSDGSARFDWPYDALILSSGQFTIEFPVQVSASPLVPEELISICSILSQITDIYFLNNSDSVFITVEPQYDLTLALLQTTEGTLAPDAQETYDLIIYNNSSAPVSNFALTVAIDDSVAGANIYGIAASTSPNFQSNSGDTLLTFFFANLAVGDSIATAITVDYAIGVNSSGRTLNFTANVDSLFSALTLTMPDINPEDNSVVWWRNFDDAFDLVLEPTPENNKSAIAINSPQTYQFTVTNNSLLDFPTRTLTVEIVPTGNAAVGNLSISNINDGVSAVTGADKIMIIWTVPALSAGSSAQFSFDAGIISVATGGNFGFTINASVDLLAGETDTGNNARSWQTTGDVAADLAVLSVTPDNTSPGPGDVVNFTIAYANLGTLPKDSANLRVVISASPDMPVYHLTNSDNANVSGDTLAWLITPLPARGDAGSQGTRTIALTFDNVTQEGRYQIEVYAEIDTHGVFDDTGNNSMKNSIELTALPSLNMSTIEFAGNLQENENITYAFTITNTGNYPARDMSLEISIPQGTNFRNWSADGLAVSPQQSENSYTITIAGLAPEATLSYIVGVQVFARVELLRQFPHGSNLSLNFSATLTDADVVIVRSYSAGLGIPRVEESFYLTRNIFRPTVHGDVDLTYDLVADTEVGFKIYNMAGELVREFAPVAGIIGERVHMVWNGRNNKNELVGSGLYFIFAEVKGNSNRPMQKLLVVR